MKVVIMAVLLGVASFDATAAAVERGVEGLSRVPFRADNRSNGPIECEATLAHWYSAKIGSAAPGDRVMGELWSDAKTGAVFLLNDKQERMPVLSLWCGMAGRAAMTRADVYLDRRAGMAEPPLDLVCDGSAAGSALSCRREPRRP